MTEPITRHQPRQGRQRELPRAPAPGRPSRSPGESLGRGERELPGVSTPGTRGQLTRHQPRQGRQRELRRPLPLSPHPGLGELLDGLRLAGLTTSRGSHPWQFTSATSRLPDRSGKKRFLSHPRLNQEKFSRIFPIVWELFSAMALLSPVVVLSVCVTGKPPRSGGKMASLHAMRRVFRPRGRIAFACSIARFRPLSSRPALPGDSAKRGDWLRSGRRGSGVFFSERPPQAAAPKKRLPTPYRVAESSPATCFNQAKSPRLAQSRLPGKLWKLCVLGNLGVDFCPSGHSNRKNRGICIGSSLEDSRAGRRGAAACEFREMFDGIGFFPYNGKNRCKGVWVHSSSVGLHRRLIHEDLGYTASLDWQTR